MFSGFSKNKEIASTIEKEPIIYNKDKQLMRTFFLSDSTFSTYSCGSQNINETRHIHWDRYNYGLPIHFYSHEKILNPVNMGKKNFGILVESESIYSGLYEKLIKKSEIINNYNGIFTHSERLIKKYNNCYFIPGGAVWYGGTAGGGDLKNDAFLHKKKNISMVSSNKEYCELHKYRKTLAEYLLNKKIADIYGTINGGNEILISESLKDYRYSVVIENCITNIYFTEKILNCFASMTIPVYIGAKKINDFFNEEGIIRIDPSMQYEEIEKILLKLNKETYDKKIEAVVDNYNRINDYLCIEDYIYNHYSFLFDV